MLKYEVFGNGARHWVYFDTDNIDIFMPDAPMTVEQAAQEYNRLYRAKAFAVSNLNYFDLATGKQAQLIKLDGNVVYKTNWRERATFIWDKTSKIERHLSTDTIPEPNAFGGHIVLLRGGEFAFEESMRIEGVVDTSSRQRTAIGIKPGLIEILVTSVGQTVQQVATLFRNDGFTDAMLLDGGGSSQLWVDGHGTVVRSSRRVPAFLVIKKNNIKIDDDLEIKQDFIPVGRRNRPGHALRAEYITIHDTGNSVATANAEFHSRYLKGSAADVPVSWHFTVDDRGIYQHLPLNEVGWHAGDGASGPGNRTSIGVEICQHQGIDRAKAEDNAAKLVRWLMGEIGLTRDKIVQHNKWNGKNCPNILRGIPGGWEQFIDFIMLGTAPVEVDPRIQQLETENKDLKRKVGELQSKLNQMLTDIRLAQIPLKKYTRVWEE